MKFKSKFQGGAMAFIGFMLSPLSWWNDLFVNVPLAVGFAWVIALIYRPAFEAALVIGYWLTNVLGLVLLHKGTKKMITGEKLVSFSRRELFRDVLVSLLYTLLILLLVKLQLIQPVLDYAPKR